MSSRVLGFGNNKVAISTFILREVSCKEESEALNRLGSYFACKRFAVQTFLWSREFVIQRFLECDTIKVRNRARS